MLFRSYDAATGKVVGTGTTAAVPLGTATINIGTFSGTIVVKVDGGANVNYLDERDTTKLYNFPAGSSLLAVIPNVGGGNISVGVTQLTNMIAASLGVTSSSFSGGAFVPPATPLTSTNVYAKVDYVLSQFGLTRSDIDPFGKPVVFGVDMVGRPAAAPARPSPMTRSRSFSSDTAPSMTSTTS